MRIRIPAALSALLLIICLLSGCTRKPDPERDLPRQTIPENSKDVSLFSQQNDGTVTYPGAMQGIDVCSFQGEIDWAKVKQAGIDFAILQIGFRGYGSGSLNLDECFEANYTGAREAGIRIGVYFYSQAVSKAEAVEEAEMVLNALGGRSLDLPVFFDWEEVAEGRTAGLANFSVGDYALEFCRRISEEGYSAGVYFNQKYGYSIMQLEALTDYTFWLAEYRSYQSFSYDVAVWQYTGQGHIDGIEVQVDRNLMYSAGE